MFASGPAVACLVQPTRSTAMVAVRLRRIVPRPVTQMRKRVAAPLPPIHQAAAMEGDCIFCRIVAEDDRTVAFLDRGQATQGHTLVVPGSHAADMWAITESDACAVMAMAKRVADLLDERLTPDGLDLTQSNRPPGWQDVFHFHLHVIPSWTGDGLVPPW
jgi:histidine triad (HIT) family protein